VPILRELARILSSAPDELSVQSGAFPGPEASLFLIPVWSGELAEGEEVVARLQKLGTPVLIQVGPVNSADVVRPLGDYIASGRHYAFQTRWLPDLTPEIISALVNAGADRTSPFSFFVLHHLHGAATRVAPDATAFGMRRKHFMLEIGAAWEPSSQAEGDIHRRWAYDRSSALARFAFSGGYANFLTRSDHEQVDSAYGNNGPQLREVKRRFDPEKVFSSTIPLPFN
jgi:hypothetical protein